MTSTTSPSLSYWNSSHAHTQIRQPGPTTSPATRPSQTPDSVGQPMPPHQSPSHVRPPLHSSQTAGTSSPNYFGFSAVADPFSSKDAVQHARQNWSPPSSTVCSTAAATPSVMPADQNPEYDAFRKRSEGKAFNLGNLHNFKMGSATSVARPSPAPRAVSKSAIEKSRSFGKYESMPPPPARSHIAQVSHLESETTQLRQSPKRQLSSRSPSSIENPRRDSPASFAHAESDRSVRDHSPSPDRHPRSALPLDRSGVAHIFAKHRAETLPAKTQEESMLVTPQYVYNLLDSASEDILLLDLRVSTQYARSRITGALNLCIPTTLLKRPSFNVQKLAETFKDVDQRAKFERWQNSKYIVVYDASSTQLKDAAICINTVKKFANESWKGSAYIIRGGFTEFAKRFSSLVDTHAGSDPSKTPPRLTLDAPGPLVAPVAGGCPMPATKNAANPFFGNIRQNMDLIGGVGQMLIKHPSSMTKSAEAELPSWLQKASDEKDCGKRVSDKFLQIEKREQKRMQEALSGNVVYGTPGAETAKPVQIAGIEKGSKNRYNNIWPYEHSRVRLEGVPNHGCDYINANHVKAAWSNKRYIATQGPIPTTFSDFWNVVWQQDVRVIVMLTAEKEGGQVKAHNYWSAGHYGPLHLEFLSECRASLELERTKRHRHRHQPPAGRRKPTNPTLPGTTATTRSIAETASPTSDQPYVIVRKLTLSHEGFPFERMREITQLQYSSWPDFGAPAHPAHLLGLVEQCDAAVRSTNHTKQSEPDPPNARPVLVHCSAGCGRTGTFCTVDSVIDMLKRQRLAKRTAREQRQLTPMEMEMEVEMEVEPASGRRRRQDESPFFGGAEARPEAAEEGAWVQRDDCDLIEKTVEEFRLQRLSMVQSLRQFVLCYESILEWLVGREEEERKEEGEEGVDDQA
ncbi:hypothetical protein LTR28_003687 [Elasticomyces elasticus]|nr:hypothetical protein LTR28_003687 [Elasticomyces elasticus]